MGTPLATPLDPHLITPSSLFPEAVTLRHHELPTTITTVCPLLLSASQYSGEIVKTAPFSTTSSLLSVTNGPFPLPTIEADSSTRDTFTPVSPSGIPQQETSTLTSSSQDTDSPIPSVKPQPGSSPRFLVHTNSAAFIVPICTAVLALLLLSGALYFRVTRKRWPFTGNQDQRVILEPYHTEPVNQVAATRNRALTRNRGSGPGNPSGESAENTQRWYPLVSHQFTSVSEAPMPREQLETQYAILMREVESIKQLLTVGAQSTQHAGQPQNDEPPDYSSRVEPAETRPPGATRGKIRNS